MFLELISRFEFDFRRRGIFFLNDSNFLVCSKFNNMQQDCPCACAVACLCPHNSISDVVASVTVHDDMQIFLRDVSPKTHETVVEGQRFLQPNIMAIVQRAIRSLYLVLGG